MLTWLTLKNKFYEIINFFWRIYWNYFFDSYLYFYIKIDKDIIEVKSQEEIYDFFLNFKIEPPILKYNNDLFFLKAILFNKFDKKVYLLVRIGYMEEMLDFNLEMKKFFISDKGSSLFFCTNKKTIIKK